MDELPKYVQNANKIIEVLAQEDDKTWSRTQRELADKLELSLPVVSNLVRTLIESGHIHRGAPLTGVRGCTSSLQLVNANPLDAPIRKEDRTNRSNDRVLQADGAIENALNLKTLTVEQIGYAVMRIMRRSWEDQERNAANRSQQAERLRQLREDLDQERRIRIDMADTNQRLEQTVAQQNTEILRMREEINKLLIRVNQRRSGGSSVPISELLDESEIDMLDRLMRTAPGNSRESDREAGLRR